jgi:hypothetical protein
MDMISVGVDDRLELIGFCIGHNEKYGGTEMVEKRAVQAEILLGWKCYLHLESFILHGFVSTEKLFRKVGECPSLPVFPCA